VNEPDDKYEREAERVADAVMRMPDPESTVGTQEEVPSGRVQRMCPRCQRRHRQGKPLNCEECEQELQRKQEAGDVPVAGGVDQAAVVTREPGKPLLDRTKSFFEERMGRDFGDVRIHTGGKADRAARSIDAQAFTLGNDMVFQSNVYQPGTREGKRLLAHELTHVVQQTGVGLNPPQEIQRQETGQTEGQGGGLCTFERSLPKGSIYRLYNFDVESTTLKSGHKSCLQQTVLPEIRNTTNAVVGVVGHASTTGSPELNETLSLQRAEAVFQWLKDHGVSEGQLKWPSGVGERRPLDPSTPHDPGVERAEDRAVRIQIWEVKRQSEDPCRLSNEEWDGLFERWVNYCESTYFERATFDLLCSGLPTGICPVLWLTNPEVFDTCCDVSATPPKELKKEFLNCLSTNVEEQVPCSESEVRAAYEEWKERKVKRKKRREKRESGKKNRFEKKPWEFF